MKRAAVWLRRQVRRRRRWGWDAYYQFGEHRTASSSWPTTAISTCLHAGDRSVVDRRPIGCRVAAIGFRRRKRSRCRPRTRCIRRSIRPLIANGCVPLNPFGNQAVSPAAQKAYAFGNPRREPRLQAAGGRAERLGRSVRRLRRRPDPGRRRRRVPHRGRREHRRVPAGTSDYVRTDYLIQYGESFSGDVDVTEGYVEISLPLLQGQAGRAAPRPRPRRARVALQEPGQGSAPRADERTHDMTTWKVTGVWDPLDWLRFRSTQSRDSRAANFRELYYGQMIGAGGTFGFCGPAGTSSARSLQLDLRGNVDLEPEKADTDDVRHRAHAGGRAAGLQFAADYFTINIDGRDPAGAMRGACSMAAGSRESAGVLRADHCRTCRRLHV